MLQAGWFNSYKSELKYITYVTGIWCIGAALQLFCSRLERVAPDVCATATNHTTDHTTDHIFNASHPNGTVDLMHLLGSRPDQCLVVREGKWQEHGLSLAKGAGKPVVLSQYSIATRDCGGDVPNTFTGTLWTIDYSLQLASVGYSAMYLHTTERGTPSNLFDYPDEGSSFMTRPIHYAYHPVLLALQSYNGSKVVDLNVDGDTNAAYAVYDSNTSDLYRVVLINYAGNGTTFTLPSSVGGNNVTVGNLTASSPEETSLITWAGQTWANSQDGQPAGEQEYQSLDCASGCDVQVPGPGAIVVMFNKQLPAGEPNGGGLPGAPGNGESAKGHNGSSGPARVFFGDLCLVFVVLISLAILY